MAEFHDKRLRFRELLSRDELTVMPGGYSPIHARMAEEIGFESFFIAGSQMSSFLFGVPDTHAPTFFALTDQCDKPEGTSTVIHGRYAPVW